MKKALLLVALSFVLTSSVYADGGALYTEKACNTCHGDSGNSTVSTFPKLAGQNAEYLVSQAKAIRDMKRKNGMSSMMQPMVANVSDAELQAIADYLSNQN